MKSLYELKQELIEELAQYVPAKYWGKILKKIEAIIDFKEDFAD